MISGKKLPPACRHNLILTGFMGTGKTAVGQILARRLKRRFIDTDRLVESKTGLTVSRTFELYGEKWFRLREKEAVASLADYPPGSLVVATGGGVVLSSESMESLESHGLIVLLTASPSEILKRTGKGGRPLLEGSSSNRERVISLLQNREPYYRRCNLQVDTTNKEPIQVAGIILSELRLILPGEE